MNRTQELLDKLGPLIDTMNTLIANACHENPDLKVEINVNHSWILGRINETPLIGAEIYERKLLRRQQ